MEMEHINENTIRVIIGNEDLADRGITFLDLLGNHKEVENFFYSILEEVDIEDQFQGSDAVTFQVLPKNDGLELFISKNQADEDYLDEFSEYLTSDEANKMLQRKMGNVYEKNIGFPEYPTETFVFVLNHFEQMIQLSHEISVAAVATNLYYYKQKYYLQVRFLDEILNENQQADALAQFLEFADKAAVTAEVLEEYGVRILQNTAIESTKYYFKK